MSRPLPAIVGLLDRGRWTRRSLEVAAVAAALLAAAPARGATDLKRGDPAPPLVMQSIDGRSIKTADMGDRVLLLLFAEAGHDKTHRACREVAAALEAKRLAGQPIDWILILSKSSRVDDLDRGALEAEPPPIIVHDTDRLAFGAYKTLVVPTVVVVGRDGRVVHTMASYTNRFGDTVFDALSVAVGKLGLEEFEQTLRPSAGDSNDLRERRAERLVHFADRLCRRGLDPMAEAKYLEALQLAPGLPSARLGLGDLLLRQQRLDEAEQQFREVLADEPESPAATLGLAFVFAHRGGVGLDHAEKVARELIEHDRSWARAHFLMGLIHEKHGDAAAAADSFKTAAQLLLSRLGPEAPSEEHPPRP
jgi:tetratricopeptide (TPR) repeat protein